MSYSLYCISIVVSERGSIVGVTGGGRPMRHSGEEQQFAVHSFTSPKPPGTKILPVCNEDSIRKQESDGSHVDFGTHFETPMVTENE